MVIDEINVPPKSPEPLAPLKVVVPLSAPPLTVKVCALVLAADAI
jgi:hypothetical protein